MMARRRRIEFEDFAVRIAADGSGGYESRILKAPGGGGSAPFVPPFQSEEVRILLRDLGRTIRASSTEARHLEAPRRGSSRGWDPREVGTRLFDALFRDEVLIAFVKSVQPGDGPGLRIRIVIDPLAPGCAEIATLPWELLYDPRRRSFLCRLQRFPVVRFLESPGPNWRQPIEGDLRVLVAICSPEELSPLDVKAEVAAAEGWGAIRGVHVEVIEHATFQQVVRRLEQERFHVFHFSGHGEIAGSDGHGSLVFDRPDGGTDRIGAELLIDPIDRSPSLRLAVLNACNSGRIPRHAGGDPFNGVATALVWSAVPAVIGMQYPISDCAAARFGEALYGALAEGDPVDAAVTKGRLAIFHADPSSLEWATPALHLRVVDGHIFERAEPVRPWRRWVAAGIAILAVVAAAMAVWLGRDQPSSENTEILGLLETRDDVPEYQRPDVEPADACPPPLDLPEMAFVLVPPGQVEVPDPGSTDGTRTVALDRPLCVAAFETMMGEWQRVMEVDEQKDRIGIPHWQYHPAAEISWEGAQEFLRRVNREVRGTPFRLPTNEEWEYLARGNRGTGYFFGDGPEELTQYANCDPKSLLGDGFEGHTAPVGSFEPNPFGLYDVYGNVWEWVTGQAEVPEGTSAEEAALFRIKRGGSYENVPNSCTSSTRNDVLGDRHYEVNGFRIVREPARH